MADYDSALIQLGTLAAGLLSQKQQQKEKEKREKKELDIDQGRNKQDAVAQIYFGRAQELGAPGAQYLSKAASTLLGNQRASDDLGRQQAAYKDAHATDYLSPSVLGSLGKTMGSLSQSSYGPSEPYTQDISEDIAAPAVSTAAGSLAPSAAAAGVAGGASNELDELMRRYGYR